MAFDGIVIANLTRDLKNKLEGGGGSAVMYGADRN